MKNAQLYILLAFAALLAVNCRSHGPVIKQPRENLPPTEFHEKPARFIPWVFFNKTSRGLDRQDDVSFFNTVGGGLGLLMNSKLDKQWDGHKFFYYYMDVDVSRQYTPEGAYPGNTQWTISSYPGVLFRTYTPFYLKMHVGMGMNLRYNQLYYDRWGVYGQMGLELWGFTSSVIFIGHPGQANWETEYRAGYMYAPTEWR